MASLFEWHGGLLQMIKIMVNQQTDQGLSKQDVPSLFQMASISHNGWFMTPITS
jgi:hypothetical protein